MPERLQFKKINRTAQAVLGYSRYMAALSWAFFIFVMLSYPMPAGIEHVFTWRDKFVHFALFGAMSLLLWHLFRFEIIWPAAKSAKINFAITAVYIAVLEIGQNYFPGRTPDARDSLAGMAGALAVILPLYGYARANKPKLLLHVCCIACGAGIFRELEKKYDADMYFFNPNIYPREEYRKRLSEARRIARIWRKKLIAGRYGHKAWLSAVKGLENQKEGGKRCEICFAYRLDATARKAVATGYEIFATTLTISPYKSSPKVIECGKRAGKKFRIKFLALDFGKGSGFRHSVEESKKLSIYRQKYCGCEFSDTYSPAKKSKTVK